MARQQAMEETAMAVRPVHQRGHGKAARHRAASAASHAPFLADKTGVYKAWGLPIVGCFKSGFGTGRSTREETRDVITSQIGGPYIKRARGTISVMNLFRAPGVTLLACLTAT